MAIDVEPRASNALKSGTVIDIQLGGTTSQARIALQVQLTGRIVAAGASNAAAGENRLDAGRVIVSG